MDHQNAAERILELRKEVEFFEKKYYVDNDPQISDFEFDMLVKELEALESQFPELITQDSPTQRVGEQSLGGFFSVEHRSPMLSLDNCYTTEELREFEERVKKNIPGQKIEYVAELKIDGLGISVLYKNGRFSRAVTRGDGIRGDDVTSNVKTIRSLPLTIEENKDTEIRGEVYLPFTSFHSINTKRAQMGEPPFANPRNAAAGSIRMLDPKEVASRHLDGFMYSFFIEGESDLDQMTALSVMQNLHFKTNPASRFCPSLEDVLSFYEEWRDRRDELDYDIDGIVIKVNSADLQRRLGSTSKFP
ncbi:NAD-dependent DNA ligase LigA, partial [Acidobacteriota bacterium]